jgi:endonuclease/exonuclease/phosphatase family metal-dependent hydrolase
MGPQHADRGSTTRTRRPNAGPRPRGPRLPGVLAVVLTVAVALVPSAPAAAATATSPAGVASPAWGQDRELTVMTRNLYLGADIATLFDVSGPEELAARTEALFRDVLASDFPARARAVAEEVAAERPDVLGLQEVSEFVVRAPDGTVDTLDYLAVLRDALARRGLAYEVQVAHENFVGEQPLPDGSTVRLADRDVILTRTGVAVANPRAGRYDAAAEVPVFGDLVLEVVRGWTSVDVTVRGETVRVWNTHLETDLFPAVQLRQGFELLALARSPRMPTVVLGDLNSRGDRTGTATYGLFRLALFADAWRQRHDTPGFTCCQAADLRNEESLLSERIDHVLHRGVGWTRASEVVGDEPGDRVGGLWPSDHAGVVATLLVL